MYNYRPISILPSLSKIMEKIIANRLFSFLENFYILYKYQFGFIPNKNTTHAISTLVDYVINSLENNEISCSIFLDSSKAFDTIDHKILLNKLYMYGIRGITHNWFKNYLSERYQCVSINNCSSSLQKIKSGVPQCSILGPILFLLYNNDLPNASNILRFLLYADDTNILYKNFDPKSITDTINKEIPKVTEWFNSNKLRKDTNKTVAMLFHTRQRTLTINECLIKINDDTIAFSTHTKFLGVNIDSNLTWKPYINHIVTKISKGVGILLHLSKELPKNILTLIYKTLILPYLTYCCLTWGFTYHTYINKLFNIKKKQLQ